MSEPFTLADYKRIYAEIKGEEMPPETRVGLLKSAPYLQLHEEDQRLLYAARDLLAALKAAVARPAVSLLKPELNPWLVQARAAIAKAEPQECLAAIEKLGDDAEELGIYEE